MTRLEAETTPMIELAEMLIEWDNETYGDEEASELADGLDRYDTINELGDLGAFED